VAAIRTLAVHSENERCTSCEQFHTVATGGPVAAVSAAIDYLDAFHQQDHVRKVQSNLRMSDAAPAKSPLELVH
jgi:hypothetical protein